MSFGTSPSRNVGGLSSSTGIGRAVAGTLGVVGFLGIWSVFARSFDRSISSRDRFRYCPQL